MEFEFFFNESMFLLLNNFLVNRGTCFLKSRQFLRSLHINKI